jgi:GDP-4-dehydro-6-deoxy-D-mannose reductase
MRALVTGGGGFVGPHLIKQLLDESYQVLATGLKLPSSASLGCETAAMDICDAQACQTLIQSYRPDVIFHLAAISYVPEAEEDFDRTMRINVGGTRNLLTACRNAIVKPIFVLASSSEVYGLIERVPVDEHHLVNPRNNYSLTKYFAEILLKQMDQLGVVRGIVVRPFNHIGPGQDDRFVASSFSKQLAEISLNLRPPEIWVGDLTALRDFSDVRDIVRGYVLASRSDGNVYNLCSGNTVSIHEVLDRLIKIAGLDVSIRVDPKRLRPAQNAEIKGSFQLANEYLGWEPTYSLEESLTDLYSDWRHRLSA